MRHIGIDILSGEHTEKETAEFYAEIVKSMTSSHFVELDCKGVEELIKESRIGLVYFGDEEDIFEGGKMAHIQQMASADRFLHPEEPIAFYFNTDPQCKKDRMFAPDEPAVALYVHSEVLPFTLQAPDDDLAE